MKRPKWSELVDELFRRSEDIYMQCASCPNPSYCTDKLEHATPLNIITLNSCCACLIQLVLESMPDVLMMYVGGDNEENEVIYILDDVILDVSDSGAVVIPKDKVNEYLESLSDFDSEKAERIRRFVEGVIKSS